MSERAMSSASRIVAGDLGFIEGPVALDNGSVLVVSPSGDTLLRVRPDARRQSSPAPAAHLMVPPSALTDDAISATAGHPVLDGAAQEDAVAGARSRPSALAGLNPG
jgi:hypothetical protein